MTFNGGGRSRCWERQPGLMPVSGTCSRWPSGTPAGRAEVAEEDGGRSVRQAHRPRPSRAGCPPPARRPQSLAAVACCAASPLCDWEGSAFSKGSPRSGAVHFFEHGKNRSLVEFGKMQSAPIRDAWDTARAGGCRPAAGEACGWKGARRESLRFAPRSLPARREGQTPAARLASRRGDARGHSLRGLLWRSQLSEVLIRGTSVLPGRAKDCREVVPEPALSPWPRPASVPVSTFQ